MCFYIPGFLSIPIDRLDGWVVGLGRAVIDGGASIQIPSKGAFSMSETPIDFFIFSQAGWVCFVSGGVEVLLSY